MKKIYWIFYAILLIVILILGADIFGFGESDNPMQITISENDNLSVLSQKLQEEGIVLNKHLFKLYYRWHTHEDTIHPGIISVYKNDSYRQLTKAIIAPATDTVTLTIPEGFEVREIVTRLFKNELIASENEFYSALKEFSFTTNQGETISGNAANLSGFLFPDTYIISQSANSEEIIRMMTDNFQKKWTDEYQHKAKKLGMTMEEVITLASIVEREARKEEDFPMVAAVFHNRLKAGKRLESCATVQYILEERKPVLSVSDTKIDSPYNTYQNAGLPPAPISSPGILAIEATLNPANHDYLYFFTDKNGDNHYAKTYEEHNALINQYGL